MIPEPISCWCRKLENRFLPVFKIEKGAYSNKQKREIVKERGQRCDEVDVLIYLLLSVMLRKQFVVVSVQDTNETVAKIEHQPFEAEYGCSVVRLCLFVEVITDENVHRHDNKNQNQGRNDPIN